MRFAPAQPRRLSAGDGRRLLVAVLLSAVAALASAQELVPLSDTSLDAGELFERVSPSIWMVLTADDQGRGVASGSAVVVAPETLVTNCHVLEKASRFSVSREAVRHPARAGAVNLKNDLCLLIVPGLKAPAVMLAHESGLRVGMRVYAVGAPRRLEQTISDGLLSALRRNDAGELQAVQTSAPISPGSSGGGLFDTHGRLIGITTSGLKESQNLNFAMPARWIAELARRNVAPILQVTIAPPAASAAPGASATPPAPARPSRSRAAPDSPLSPPSVPPPAALSPPPQLPATTPPAAASEGPSRIAYLLTDRLTRKTRRAVFVRDQPTVDGPLSFNQGSWVESATGEVSRAHAGMAGEFDTVTPPGGWGRAGLAAGQTWTARYDVQRGDDTFRMNLDARVEGAPAMEIDGRPVDVLRIDYSGYMQKLRTAGFSSSNQAGPYRAVVWYAPALRRVLRFEARTRGGASGGAFHVDELLELVELR